MPEVLLLGRTHKLDVLLEAVHQCWLPIAGGLEHSEREILNLRSQQGRFEERVAMMQGLLKVRLSAQSPLL